MFGSDSDPLWENGGRVLELSGGRVVVKMTIGSKGWVCVLSGILLERRGYLVGNSQGDSALVSVKNSTRNTAAVLFDVGSQGRKESFAYHMYLVEGTVSVLVGYFRGGKAAFEWATSVELLIWPKKCLGTEIKWKRGALGCERHQVARRSSSRRSLAAFAHGCQLGSWVTTPCR